MLRLMADLKDLEEIEGVIFMGLHLQNEMSCHFSQSLHSQKIPGWGLLVKADVPIRPLKQTEHKDSAQDPKEKIKKRSEKLSFCGG